jgi:predicted GNAT superfamily acetyltransferase
MGRVAADHKVCVTRIKYRFLSTREECASVNALERQIWGPVYDEAIPVALLLMTLSRGAILIGAFDDDEQLIGFVYSLSGMKNGKPVQWSYKLGVTPKYRNDGVGLQLKLRQRERALDMGIDFIEWTFDPMLAANAYLNLAKLGAFAGEYAADVYGESLAPVMHRGLPTDRLIATWNIRDTEVAKRISETLSGRGNVNGVTHSEIEGAVTVNRAAKRDGWLECSEIFLQVEAPRLKVEIPISFSDMISCVPAVALEWRLSVRRIFSVYFARGYRAIEFLLFPSDQKGVYLLSRTPEPLLRK